jgi:tetrahydromethanopterin S-methyltransferase subunit G
MVNYVDEVESVEERLDELENAVNTIMKRLVEIS